ncbi:MAG: prepilin-type N-terminal cleavage/methylation domain-containing protein [Verrucomicrobiota bacterium]
MRHGFSLMETVIALAVLAVSVPLVFLALEKGGRAGMASATDSRCARMADACLEEIRASQESRARWLPNENPGAPIPPEGSFWALAFSNEGHVMGQINADQWAAGVAHIDGEAVRYLASMDSDSRVLEGMPVMRRVRVTVEEPAAAAQENRAKSKFYTLMP